MSGVFFPKPLVSGKKIAVCNVSSHVPESLHARFELVIADLRTRGFEVVIDKYSLIHATSEQKARAFQSYLQDDTVVAIMPPWGGDIAMEMLTHINFEILKEVEPKWLIGFSDVSTVAMALLSLLGWASCHTSNLMQLNLAQNDPLTKNTFEYLSQMQFEQESSEWAESALMDWVNHPDDTFKLTQETNWYSLSDKSSCHFTGRLIGGCLDTLHLLCCTRYFELTVLKNTHAKDGVILYLENAELTESQVYRALLLMRMSGMLDGLKGVIFGRDYKNSLDIRKVYKEIFDDKPHSLDYPVLYNADIGHVAPNMTLINGALASVEYRSGRVKLHQSLSKS